MTLWDKGAAVPKDIMEYTVGKDHELDLALVPFDCDASIAHAKMLSKIGVLTGKEAAELTAAFRSIKELHAAGNFSIAPQDEDCHTAIEKQLTEKLGDTGKKIHTGRSRNDQVAVALRLFMKDRLQQMKKSITQFQEILGKSIATFGGIMFPGYTHAQKAMPAPVSMWLGSFKDSMEDNKRFIDGVLKIIDQNPLGSGAGFGIPVFNLDKELTTKALGFAKVQENPLYVQLARGKFESIVMSALSAIAFDLNKLASDIILFSMQEFGYVKLPGEICTGSSIMPQKKNPDVLEILRGSYHVIVGNEMKIKGIMGNLMSGYSRDLQLTKGPLMESCKILLSSLQMATSVIGGMEIDEERCAAAMTPELYATEEAYKLVKEGMPFRDAYAEIGKKYG
ncbi:MAG: argininosuccinate lyase [DPANN group archaeon]|nr:argininosuccinate lyase [DPANN group archaeon]